MRSLPAAIAMLLFASACAGSEQASQQSDDAATHELSILGDGIGGTAAVTESQTAVPSTTAVPSPSPQDEVADYFRRRASVFYPEIMVDLDPASTLVDEYFAEPLRSRWTEALQRWSSQSARGEGMARYRIDNIEVVTSQRALATVCFQADVTFTAADGAVVLGPQEAPFMVRYELLRGEEEQWLLSNQTKLWDPQDTRFFWECEI